MSTSPEGYLVILEGFAKTHYCKDFEKKASWSATWKSLEQTFARFNPDLLAGKLEPALKISDDRKLILYKFSFRMADDNKSAKASGNRVILVSDEEHKIIRVLLVYHKNHVKGDRETDWFMKLIYDEYKNLP